MAGGTAAGEPGARRTRGTILAAATRLFGDTGYTGTSMRDIASAVGVLPGSLYAHIDNKETLLLEIVEEGIDEFLEQGGAALAAHARPAERLRALIGAHIAVVARNPDRTLVVFHQWRFLSGDNLQRVTAKRRRYEELVRGVVEDGRASGEFDAVPDPTVAVLVVLGALNWAAEWYRPDGPEPPERVGDRLADALIGGLRTRSEARSVG